MHIEELICYFQYVAHYFTVCCGQAECCIQELAIYGTRIPQICFVSSHCGRCFKWDSCSEFKIESTAYCFAPPNGGLVVGIRREHNLWPEFLIISAVFPEHWTEVSRLTSLGCICLLVNLSGALAALVLWFVGFLICFCVLFLNPGQVGNRAFAPVQSNNVSSGSASLS